MAVGTPTTANGSGSTATVAVPAGLATGDEVIIVLSEDNSTGTITGPSGFTALANGVISDDGQKYWIGWKRMGGTPDSGDYTITWTGGTTDWAVTAIPVTGRDGTNPPVLGTLNHFSGGSTVTALSVTAAAGDDILFISVPDMATSTAVTHSGWSAPFTEIVDESRSFAQVGVAKAENVSAGATGNATATLSTGVATNGVAWLLQIPESTGGGGGVTVKSLAALGVG